MEHRQNQVFVSANADDVSQCISYVKELTYVLRNERDKNRKIEMFAQAVIDFGAQRIDKAVFSATVKELLKGHTDLILGLNSILPNAYHIILDEEAHLILLDFRGTNTSQKPKVTKSEALSYMTEVKNVFRNKREKFEMFLHVIKDFKTERIDRAGFTAMMKELLQGHNNLILGLNSCLPKEDEIPLDDENGLVRKIKLFGVILEVKEEP